MTSTPASRIEDFQGDYEALAAMIAESWSENEDPLSFDVPFLRSLLSYPGASTDLAPTLYADGQPKAFTIANPRSVMLGRKPFRLGLGALVSVAPEYKGLAGGLMLREMAKRVRTRGFDGMIHYAIDGEPMSRMLLPLCRAIKLPTVKFFTIGYLSRLLFPKPKIEWTPDPGAAQALVSLSQKIDAPLRRTWTLAEAEWQCFHRSGAVSALHREGERSGLITGYIQQVATGARPYCLFVDDVLFGDLEEPERNQLVRRFLDTGAALGASLAVAPRLGYFDEAPLTAAKFRPSNRSIHAFLSLWEHPLPAEKLDSVYIDAF